MQAIKQKNDETRKNMRGFWIEHRIEKEKEWKEGKEWNPGTLLLDKQQIKLSRHFCNANLCSISSLCGRG
jgi:hypothetical protein